MCDNKLNVNTRNRIEICSEDEVGSSNSIRGERKYPDVTEIESEYERDDISICSLSEYNDSNSDSIKVVADPNRPFRTILFPGPTTDSSKIENIATTNSRKINVGDNAITQVAGNVVVNQIYLPQNNNSDANEPEQSNRIVNRSERNKRRKYSIIALMLIIGICVCILSVAFKSIDVDTECLVSEFEEETLPGDKTVIIVPRTKWITQVGNRKLNDMKLPARHVIIAHTATSNCSTRVICASIISNQLQDREYNFLVGGDAIYEGSGWYKVGLHTKKYLNAKSICFAFIGNYENHKPSAHQIEAVKKMIEWGVEKNKLKKEYQLSAQCNYIPTDSPGAALIDEIKNWDNYSNLERKSRKARTKDSSGNNNGGKEYHLCRE